MSSRYRPAKEAPRAKGRDHAKKAYYCVSETFKSIIPEKTLKGRFLCLL